MISLSQITALVRSNAALALADQGVVSATNFAVGVLLARALGVEGFGWFALVLLVLQMAGSLQQAFVITPLLSLLPQLESNEQSGYLAALNRMQLMLLVVFAGAACIIMAVPLVAAAQPELIAIAFPGLCLLAGYLLHEVFRKRQYASNTVRNALVIDVGISMVQLGGMLGCQYYGTCTLESTIWVMAASYLPAALLQLAACRKPVSSAELRMHAHRTWTYSKYLVGTAVLQWLSSNSFIVAAGAVLGPVGLGAVRMAQNLVGVINVLLLVMEHKAPVPMARHFAEAGAESLMVFTRNFTLRAGLITGALLLALAAFCAPVVELLYGAEYLAYVGLVRAFVALYVLVFISTVLRLLIQTVARNHAIFIAYLATGASGLLLAAPMVQHFGLIGVVGGLFLSQLISLGILVIALKKELPLLWKSSTSY